MTCDINFILTQCQQFYAFFILSSKCKKLKVYILELPIENVHVLNAKNMKISKVHSKKKKRKEREKEIDKKKIRKKRKTWEGESVGKIWRETQ